MAWNEPGEQKPQDPWKRGSGNGGGPPDLDEVLSGLLKRLSGLFGGKPRPSGSGSNSALLMVALTLAGVFWLLSGFFIINEAQQGVLLRFGQYHTALTPGWHWMPRFVDKVSLVDVNTIRSVHTEGMMLTQDENIVEITLGVQFKVNDARQYLFSVKDVEGSLLQATDSSLRYVIGHSTMDDVLTTGREQIRRLIWDQLNQVIEPYKMGIQILDVTLQDAIPPQQVQASFDDAIKAQEDEERFINEAQAYERKKEPIARGGAQRILQEAEAYKQQVILNAKGDIAKFEQLLPQYQQAPAVTRQRLYLATMEQVLSQTNKILVEGSNPVLYLPMNPATNDDKTKTDGLILPTLLPIDPASAAPAAEPDAESPSSAATSATGRVDRFKSRGQ